MKKLLVALMVLTTLLLGACSNEKENNAAELPVTQLSGSFSIDVHDLSQIVGDADYVFVAKVNKELETVYRDNVTIKTEDGSKEISDPYTKYSVEVIDNFKGNLKQNAEIELLKAGGISDDKKSIVLYEEDELLEVGQYHILSAYAQPDGSLLVSGPNSSEILAEASKEKAIASESYKKYTEALNKGFESERKRFKSTYEE